ncbi:MAG TPA: GNAT family N-acetyltransferase [Solirubrobacteraceae bacterium]|nr:GNAT family N-acetyltransferase [Solirubrobacteraceae bacterium]
MAGQHKVETITAEDIPAFVAGVEAAFHDDPAPGDVERITKKLEIDRTIAIRDGERVVAGASIYSRRMTVPGGEVPIAGVTQVGVQPTHRRRGMLTAMMRRQLDDVRAAGNEAVAALWAAEAAIYGRFGYGLASLSGEVRLDTRDVRVRTPTTLRPRLTTPAEALDGMRAIYGTVRPTRPGMLDREGPWWDVRLQDEERDREGASALRAAVIDDHAYALYAVKTQFEENRFSAEVQIRELMAATREGYAAIWDFLLNLDLTRRLHYLFGPSDDPLMHLVTEAQATPVRLHEALWVRLVDLPRALRERTYGEPFEVVLEVADEFCPWNAGRWALRWDGSTAMCGETALAPGLQLTAAELGAAYLGGTTLTALAQAGRVTELRTGALASTSRSFRGDVAPWCPEIF